MIFRSKSLDGSNPEARILNPGYFLSGSGIRAYSGFESAHFTFSFGPQCLADTSSWRGIVLWVED